MSPSNPHLRPAAAAFLVAALPLAVAIAVAGGVLALAPLALLLIPVLVTGRAPGVERLGALAARRPLLGRRTAAGGLLIAASLSKRGPPLPA
jgi:hypothetical protein